METTKQNGYEKLQLAIPIKLYKQNNSEYYSDYKIDLLAFNNIARILRIKDYYHIQDRLNDLQQDNTKAGKCIPQLHFPDTIKYNFKKYRLLIDLKSTIKSVELKVHNKKAVLKNDLGYTYLSLYLERWSNESMFGDYDNEEEIEVKYKEFVYRMFEIERNKKVHLKSVLNHLGNVFNVFANNNDRYSNFDREVPNIGISHMTKIESGDSGHSNLVTNKNYMEKLTKVIASEANNSNGSGNLEDIYHEAIPYRNIFQKKLEQLQRDKEMGQPLKKIIEKNKEFRTKARAQEKERQIEKEKELDNILDQTLQKTKLANVVTVPKVEADWNLIGQKRDYEYFSDFYKLHDTINKIHKKQSEIMAKVYFFVQNKKKNNEAKIEEGRKNIILPSCKSKKRVEEKIEFKKQGSNALEEPEDKQAILRSLGIGKGKSKPILNLNNKSYCMNFSMIDDLYQKNCLNIKGENMNFDKDSEDDNNDDSFISEESTPRKTEYCDEKSASKLEESSTNNQINDKSNTNNSKADNNTNASNTKANNTKANKINKKLDKATKNMRKEMLYTKKRMLDPTNIDFENTEEVINEFCEEHSMDSNSDAINQTNSKSCISKSGVALPEEWMFLNRNEPFENLRHFQKFLDLKKDGMYVCRNRNYSKLANKAKIKNQPTFDIPLSEDWKLANQESTYPKLEEPDYLSKGRMDYEDGKSFFGNLINSKPDGYGYIKNQNGEYQYRGYFKDGMKHGFGVEKIEDKVERKIVFFQKFLKKQNKVVEHFYEGSYEFGKKEGWGVEYHRIEGRKEIQNKGQYKNDKRNGVILSYKKVAGIVVHSSCTHHSMHRGQRTRGAKPIIIYNMATSGKFFEGLSVKRDQNFIGLVYQPGDILAYSGYVNFHDYKKDGFGITYDKNSNGTWTIQFGKWSNGRIERNLTHYEKKKIIAKLSFCKFGIGCPSERMSYNANNNSLFDRVNGSGAEMVLETGADGVKKKSRLKNSNDDWDFEGDFAAGVNESEIIND